MEYLDKTLDPITFWLGAHFVVYALAIPNAAQEASLLKRTLDCVVNHIVRNDALFWAINCLDAVSAMDQHLVALAVALNK